MAQAFVPRGVWGETFRLEIGGVFLSDKRAGDLNAMRLRSSSRHQRGVAFSPGLRAVNSTTSVLARSGQEPAGRPKFLRQ